MKKGLSFKIVILTLTLTLLLGLSAVVFATNTQSDPLVTLSYVTGSYKDDLIDGVKSSVSANQKALEKDFSKDIASFKSQLKTTKVTAEENQFETITMTAGKTIQISTGSEILMISGVGEITIGDLTDTTAGKNVKSGGVLDANHLYISAADGTITAQNQVQILVKF